MTREEETQLGKDAIAAFNAEAKRTGLSAKDIWEQRGGALLPVYRDARCRVAQELKRRGWELWQIGRAMRVGVDTVRLYVKGIRDHGAPTH